MSLVGSLVLFFFFFPPALPPFFVLFFFFAMAADHKNPLGRVVKAHHPSIRNTQVTRRSLPNLEYTSDASLTPQFGICK
jgi:hypothetical protein